MWMTRDGYLLQLSATAASRIAARASRTGMTNLIGAYPSGNPIAAVKNIVGRLARASTRARGLHSAYSRSYYDLFTSSLGRHRYQLITRPVSARGRVIVGARRLGRAPLKGLAGEAFVHPGVRKSATQLRREARKVFLQVYPRYRRRKGVQVHHRIPLEYRRLFPSMDPNSLSNLQPLTSLEHRRKASDMWDAFRATYRRRKQQPTPLEVRNFANLVDRSLQLPVYL